MTVVDRSRLGLVVLACVGGCADPSSDERGGATGSGGSDGALVMPTFPVEFTPPSGTFSGAIAVTLSTDQVGAELRYTTDGTPPTASSPLYDGTPIPVSRSTEIRVTIFSGGVATGSATGVYVATAIDVAVDLPLVVLDVYGAGEPDRETVDAALLVYDVPGATLSGVPTVASHAGVHLRGNSSALFDKPPYRLELRDVNDEDLDLPLLGMPAEADWVLRNPYADKALIRDAFFYGLAREMGLAAPRYAFCELYRNVDAGPLSADDYLGVYLVVETIKNQKHRLDLEQLEESDLTLPAISGGYIFKFEWQAAEEPIVECAAATHCWQDLEVADPVPLMAEQEAWLAEHLTGFVNALFSDAFADPASGYAAYIDVASFVDQVILNELGREMDAYVRSQFFHKDRDTKIFAGPIWDRDLTFDVGGYFGNRDLEGFMVQSQFDGGSSGGGFPTGGGAMTRTGGNDWFPRLLEDPGFQAQVNARWQSLRGGLLSDAALDARVASLTAPLAAAAARNFARWDILTTEMVAGIFYTPTEGTWEGQVAHLKDWMHQRVAWLDTQWR